MTPRPIDGKVRSRALSRSRTLEASILNRLTERDTQICIDIFDHRFLTTTQIFQLHFDSLYRARARTLELFELNVLDRFRPPKRPGSWPFHYVLDRLGAAIVAGAINVDPSLYFERNRVSRLVRSRRLSHMRSVNDFFCGLAYAARATKNCRLDRWLGEARSSGHCQGIVHPDGIGTLKSSTTSTSFFLELDRGTENIDQLAAKIIDYDEAAVSKHLPRVLLFCFQTERREHSAMPALRSRCLIVATSTLERHLSDPFGLNWLPIQEERRVKLLEIPMPEEESQ